MADDDVRVPAGWYPDPLGLPQLRWWDNHAWTEHTSDARQPMVATETIQPKLKWADDDEPVDEHRWDDLPSRRQRREQERLQEDHGADLATPDSDLANADPLLSLEAPSHAEVVEEPSPAVRLASAGAVQNAPTSEPYLLDTRYDDLTGLPSAPVSASDHVGESATTLIPETPVVAAAEAATAQAAAQAAAAQQQASADAVTAAATAAVAAAMAAAAAAAATPAPAAAPEAPATTTVPAEAAPATAAAGGFIPPTEQRPHTAEEQEAWEQFQQFQREHTLREEAFAAQAAQQAKPQPVYTTRRDAVAGAQLAVSTGPVWIIALMPLIMLVLALLFLLSGTAGKYSSMFGAIILIGPYISVIMLAIVDRSQLKRMGYQHTAHWGWAFLTAPIYLMVRLANVVRETGRGFGPLLAWGGLFLLAIGAVVSVPGVVMSLAPQQFSHAAEASVVQDGKILGADLTVQCPDVPPLLIQQTMQCRAIDAHNKVSAVTVSLQRANGWIDWRVDDWGVYQMSQ